MNLLEKYKKMSKDEDSFQRYVKCGNEPEIYGNMFYFRQTSFRNLMDFKKSYDKFKEVDGINRSEWKKSDSYGQHLDKHRTVRMFGSKLFSKNERVYYKTQKGLVMDKIIENKQRFSEKEEWFLVYLLILDSYFNRKINYILGQTKYVFENFLASGITEDNILIAIKEILTSKINKKVDLANKNYLYMDTFYRPYKNKCDFLSLYHDADDAQKQELHQYVEDNLRNKRTNCIISKKYQNSGNYTIKMLLDNAKILFITNYINKMSNISFEEFIITIVEKYKEIERIDVKKITNFVFENKDVFEIIYFNIFEIDYLENGKPEVETEEETVQEEAVQEETVQEEKIDDTSTKNIEELRRVSNILKKKAKERAGYRCELESLSHCNRFYFTSKKSKRNFLVAHHFVPREFSNEFEKSIEVIENYISLCPRCHAMIHSAEDRERKPLIHFIYSQRSQKLKDKGLGVSLEEIEKFYRIDE